MVNNRGTLLDDFMPEWDVRSRHAIRVIAPPERVYACLRSANFDHWGLIRILSAVRTLPLLATAPGHAWRRARSALAPHRISLEDTMAGGFTVLAERSGDELVLGTVGRFWRAGGERRSIDPARFREPAPRGTAKAAWSISVSSLPNGGTQLRTETRVLCADSDARRSFRRYWLLIKPFSGLIRREMLAAVRSAAEARQR